MKKIMEIYEAENGLIITKKYNVYHLFAGIEEKEDVQSVKILSTYDALCFFTNYFNNNYEKFNVEKIILDDKSKTIDKITLTFKIND